VRRHKYYAIRYSRPDGSVAVIYSGGSSVTRDAFATSVKSVLHVLISISGIDSIPPQ
jgi:hypothetical protein